jgi:hypothetical protein
METHAQFRFFEGRETNTSELEATKEGTSGPRQAVLEQWFEAAPELLEWLSTSLHPGYSINSNVLAPKDRSRSGSR